MKHKHQAEESPEPRRRKKRRKKRASRERTVAIVLGSLAALLVLAAVGAWGFLRYSSKLHEGMFADRSSQEMQQIRQQKQQKAETAAAEDPGQPEPEPTPNLLDADWIDAEGRAYRYREDVLTVLVMGVDYMKDSVNWERGTTNGGNADILALAILDSTENKLSILYIPRDTMTDVLALDSEGNYKDTLFTNISEAHSYGDGGALSCELTVDAVSNLCFGIPINRYVALDYNSLPVINEALGGLEITFDRDYTEINYAFREGETVRLTNEQFKRLISYRDHSEVDGAYKRGMRDLNMILRAMFRQMKALVKVDPGSALRIYNQLEPYITTNLSVDEVSFLAQQMTKVSFGDGSVVNMPGSTLAGEKYAEFYPDEQWLHDFIAAAVCETLN